MSLSYFLGMLIQNKTKKFEKTVIFIAEYFIAHVSFPVQDLIGVRILHFLYRS